jgi:hypothetical protein
MLNMDDEIWKPIVGYEEFYEVSNKGRIRRTSTGKIRIPFINQGYALIHLSTKGMMTPPLRVHRIVAAAFIGPRPNGYEVNHLNGIRSDNRADNLQYCTSSENKRHAARILRSKIGEKSASSKLTLEQAREIASLPPSVPFPYVATAKKYLVSARAIYSIRKGINWAIALRDP